MANSTILSQSIRYLHGVYTFDTGAVTTVLTEVYLLCFIESVSLRELGKPTSRAERSK